MGLSLRLGLKLSYSPCDLGCVPIAHPPACRSYCFRYLTMKDTSGVLERLIVSPCYQPDPYVLDTISTIRSEEDVSI